MNFSSLIFIAVGALSLLGCQSTIGAGTEKKHKQGGVPGKRQKKPHFKETTASRYGPIKRVEPKYRTEISIDAENLPIHDVLAEIREKTGAAVFADPRVKVKVTLALRDLPWRSIVQVIAALYKLEMKERDGRLLFSAPPRTSMEFVDADLQTTLLLLAKKSGKNIIIAPEVQGRVNARLKGVRPEDALKAIARNAGYEVVGEGGSKSVKRR
jgi:type II secretory pathway component GspD/PulD (secretin)